MSDEQRTALGPVGEVLMHNVRRIREGQRLTFVALAERLMAMGRPIAVLGLRRIERGERRVDVDDLLALARALNCTPVDLLVPGTLHDIEPYAITPTTSMTAGEARDWIGGNLMAGSAAELAEAVRWMSPARGNAVMREWLRRNQRNDLDQIDSKNEMAEPETRTRTRRGKREE